MSFDEVAGLEVRLAAELELFRLKVRREAVHEMWLQAAKAGRRSVDKEDDWEDGSAALAIQRRESEVHGGYTRYLQTLLDGVDTDIRKSMAELVPRLPGT